MKRSYKHFNTEQFLNDVYLSKLNEEIPNLDNINEAASRFETTFREILEVHAPVKIFHQRKNYVPYLSEETKLTISEKKAVLSEAIKNNDPSLLREAKKLSKIIKSLIKKDEKSYYAEKTCIKSDSKCAWNTVNQILNRKKNLAPTSIEVMNERNICEAVTNPKKLANIFNNHFVEKVEKIRSETAKREPLISPCERLQRWLEKRDSAPPPFGFTKIGTSEFRDMLKKFKPKKVHGVDWIDSHSLKISAPLIEEALIHLINLSLSTGSFAENWKPQLIFPIFKKKEKCKVENYRPVSHLVQIGKMIELIAHKQIVDHFEKHSLFHPNHYGSVANHSTTTATLCSETEKKWPKVQKFKFL